MPSTANTMLCWGLLPEKAIVTVDELLSGWAKGGFDAHVFIQMLIHCCICLPDFWVSLTSYTVCETFPRTLIHSHNFSLSQFIRGIKEKDNNMTRGTEQEDEAADNPTRSTLDMFF